MSNDTSSLATLADVEARLAAGDTFVLNQIAQWCPDCTVRQRPALPAFEAALARGGLPLVTLCVQETRGVYLSEAHAQLSERIGGAGYPRTLLVKEGRPASVDSGLNRVEVMSEPELIAYAEAMIAAL
ncbi:hypothetical protein FBG13_08820 [Cobetia marina]|jgi:hypothetical protein|uniref:TlpA family protein disulfide reductase n=1 Tax=Cobetia TaxID=204286 RepID=UPI0010ADA9D7|nr:MULTISPECIES: hypothetical protein [Cobetia]MDA5562544.1 hypothetical protein [Cobetia sp. MMG027]MDN2656754.1 hypothetical protein [Cobetia sp. 14N.309.X.WAT.E.A4]TKD63028.1 hypothetical protein FBG13_08820 [Cobetia marina]GED43873.1 hypothetical protein HHA02_32020 [Cobetia marina]